MSEVASVGKRVAAAAQATVGAHTYNDQYIFTEEPSFFCAAACPATHEIIQNNNKTTINNIIATTTTTTTIIAYHTHLGRGATY